MFRGDLCDCGVCDGGANGCGADGESDGLYGVDHVSGPLNRCYWRGDWGMN